jgi:shikimate kinase
MPLNQTEFLDALEQNALRLCFVGMSNIGKSHSSRLLKSELNFDSYEVDDQIQQSMSLNDIGSSANWMGYPFDERYQKNKHTYLTLESEKTLAAPINTSQNLVLDTTGSVIYLETSVKNWLSENFIVVNFDCAENMLSTMSDNYFKHPKPVVWGESFNPKAEEEGLNALKRCYPQLLTDRTRLYRELADVTIPGEVSRSQGLSAQRLVDLIYLNLPKH